ncbi:MAG: cation-transporting P-type ATPase, partial [Verrucomicrobiia bacterium]
MPNLQEQRAVIPSSEVEWASRLVTFLRSRAETRAARWDDAHTAIEVGTIGPVDLTLLQEHLQASFADDRIDAGALQGFDVEIRRSGRMTSIEKARGCEEMTRLWTWRKVPWPSAEEAAGVEREKEEDWRFLAALAAVCGLFGLAGMLVGWLGIGPAWLAPVLFIASMIAGGWDAATDAGPNLLRGRLDVHFLMLAVAAGASAIGAFGEGALLLFLFSSAGALEHFALHRTKREIDALFRLAPKTASLIVAGEDQEKPVPIEEVRAGDHVRVRPGETFP